MFVPFRLFLFKYAMLCNIVVCAYIPHTTDGREDIIRKTRFSVFSKPLVDGDARTKNGTRMVWINGSNAI